jgi:XisI protein
MDKLKKYHQIASLIVCEIAEKLNSDNLAESILSTDSVHGQYIILSDGWEGSERNYGPLVHIEVKPNAKVWLRYDGTDLEVGQELLDNGILSEDLVLAFYSPNMRKYTSFAIA